MPVSSVYPLNLGLQPTRKQALCSECVSPKACLITESRCCQVDINHHSCHGLSLELAGKARRTHRTTVGSVCSWSSGGGYMGWPGKLGLPGKLDSLGKLGSPGKLGTPGKLGPHGKPGSPGKLQKEQGSSTTCSKVRGKTIRGCRDG